MNVLFSELQNLEDHASFGFVLYIAKPIKYNISVRRGRMRFSNPRRTVEIWLGTEGMAAELGSYRRFLV